MPPERSTSRLGGVLQALGFLWLALFVVSNLFFIPGATGDFFRFFGSNLAVPIILIFAGRVVRRRERRRSLGEASSPAPSSDSSPSRPDRRARPPAREVEPDRSTAAVQRRERREMAEAHPGIGGDTPQDHMRAVAELLEKEMSFRPKTSEEMIAEAHRRWSRKD